jgi:DMSO/TMAO reductase YedYZ heme-binding membrane subunit
MSAPKKDLILLDNPRFYILAAALMLSVLISSWLRLTVPSDQLFIIRVEQIFGYMCMVCWYVALITSPLQKQLNGRFGTNLLVFCRRAIGVSGAYFALLHVMVALFGQIGGWSGTLLLPPRFLWAIGLGTVALLILLAMAATSFNKVIVFMTFPRWKWLHRLGYIGGTLVLVHIWMIGTHMSYLSFRSVIFIFLLILLRLESVRIADNLAKRYSALQEKRILISVALWIIATVLLLILPQFFEPTTNHHMSEAG